MNTSKPFSTISYNTDKFLTSKLTELVNQHIISFWCFIKHKGEEEVDITTGETIQDKDHIHLYVEPNKTINTDDFRSQFFELDPANPLPLGCLPCRSSKFDDFYLYGLHDEEYLASKYEIKQYHYLRDEFITSDINTFNNLIFELMHTSKYVINRNFLRYLQTGGSITALAHNGTITPTQAFAYKNFSDLYYKHERGERNE